VFRRGLRGDDPVQWYGRLSTVDPATGVMTVQPDYARLLDYASPERIRHYLEARAELWEGQIVPTMFIRAYIQGGLFHMEGIAYLLPPIAARYRVVDSALPPEPALDLPLCLWQALRRFALDTSLLVLEPFSTVASMARSRYRENWYRRMLQARRPVDHGPAISLRQFASEPVYQQMFQELDVYRFFSSVRERAMKSVQRELIRAGYSVTEFNQMVQSVVQNNSFGGIQNNNTGGGSQTVSGVQSTGTNTTITQSTG
jgi:hypothetical protein